MTREIVDSIVARPQFRREYLDAFWGQATPLEKAVTLVITDEATTTRQEILHRLQRAGFTITEDEFRISLEYLELYCILERTDVGVHLLAEHFPEYIRAEIIDRENYLSEKLIEYEKTRPQ